MRRSIGVALLLLGAGCREPRPWEAVAERVPPAPEPPIRAVRTVPDFVCRDATTGRTTEIWLYEDDGVDATFVTVQEPGFPPRAASPEEWTAALDYRNASWAEQDPAGKLAHLRAVYDVEQTRRTEEWDTRIAHKEATVADLEQERWNLTAQIQAIEATGTDAPERGYLRGVLSETTERLSQERARLTLLRLKRTALFGP